LHVGVQRFPGRRFVLIAVCCGSAAACDSQSADLQANVRMAVRPHGSEPPRAPAAPPREERIDDMLAAVATGHEGDGLPARIEGALARDDAAVPAALAFVRGDRSTKVIIDALAVAGTPASQDALCALARDSRLPVHVRAETVASLGLVRHPTAPTMTVVGELIRTRDQDLLPPALFLAGTVARAGRTEHPAQSVALERAVLAESARARTTDEVLEALAALGNLGSNAVLPRLRTALAAEDPRVRAAATRALRLVPDAEADHLIAVTLRRDRDATVRAAALFAAGFRKLDPLSDALTETAQKDPVDYVRSGAVTLLARNHQPTP
jgi:hypothetical protein